jgi:nitric oxide reductase activation protein
VWLGTIKPILMMRARPDDEAGAAGDGDAAELGRADELRALDDEEEFERSRILELFAAPLRNPLAAAIQRFFDMGRSPGGGDGGGGEELPVGGRQQGPVSSKARRVASTPGLAMRLGGPSIGHRYPEYDCERRRMRPDHCMVAHFDPPPPEPGAEALGVARDGALVRELARLGLSHERHRHQADGDVLDLTALVELVSDRRCGRDGDPRVYEARRRTARDLGVLVLLDSTGSTGESAEGARVFDAQRRLAGALTAALDELGDRVATYGFYSRGREAVRFLRVKDFDDRYDHGARTRLARISPGGYTRLGAAVRHATFLLGERAGTAQLLLVVIGDGLPYEDGYEHRYAHEDTRHALAEAVERGVGCACVTVRASTDEEILDKVWGGVAHRRLADAGGFAWEARALFAEALKTAAASRRRVGAPRRAVAA